MVVWSYLATMSVDPGGVPPGWHPFDADAIPVDDAGWAEALIREHSATAERQGLRDPADRARTYMERPRWCKKCQVRACCSLLKQSRHKALDTPGAKFTTLLILSSNHKWMENVPTGSLIFECTF